MYNSIKSAKTLWKALDKNFKVEAVVMKMFIVSKFINLKMIFESNKLILSKNCIRTIWLVLLMYTLLFTYMKSQYDE